MSFTKLSLLTGVIWATWHAPLLLFADYNSGTNRVYAMSCFTVMIIATSFIFAWLRLKSESLWPPVVLHASHNLFVQTVFDSMVRDTGKTLWYTTEFGAALAVVTAGFAMYFWTRRADVESKQSLPSLATLG
jgi:membrane protease YdiL (CAAX protease family)